MSHQPTHGSVFKEFPAKNLGIVAGLISWIDKAFLLRFEPSGVTADPPPSMAKDDWRALLGAFPYL